MQDSFKGAEPGGFEPPTSLVRLSGWLLAVCLA
jgi:hypothetical protein